MMLMKKYGYECLIRDFDRLAEQYPEKINIGCAGETVLGRKIMYLTVGDGEKTLLMLGAHHGREYITSAFLMRLCGKMLKEDRGIFAKVRLAMIPMVNPDGVELSIRGEAAADERIIAMPRLKGTYASWKANANGVDLNRNYPCLWERKNVVVSSPASEMYNGPAAATEPEVRAVMRLTEQLDPLLAITLHTKGEEIFWGDSNTTELHEESMKYARRISEISGYRILPPSEDPSIYAAGYENWFRERFRRPCILLEMGRYDGPEPFCEEKFDAEIWQKLKDLGKEMVFMMLYT